jgi:hypothetical protein
LPFFLRRGIGGGNTPVAPFCQDSGNELALSLDDNAVLPVTLASKRFPNVPGTIRHNDTCLTNKPINPLETLPMPENTLAQLAQEGHSNESLLLIAI